MSEQQLRFLLLKQVVAKTGLSAPSIRRHVRAGDFPKPFNLSPKRIAFWEHEVDAWMLALAARGRADNEEKQGERRRE